ncbi:MAG TPA: type II TA system antitoxin MqsA family protein [Anditalea sp.]|nr:type II TA system antitoxin MqsA family protein [Anditalea sp.]
MKSPITGKEMKLSYEWREVPFRKESFKIPFQFYKCENSGEQFTTTTVDEVNMLRLYTQYRAKHHIPLPEEIKAMREKYEVKASRMGEILGFGPNTYAQYEKGDLPTMANANLLKIAKDPAKFLTLVNDWEPISAKAKTDLIQRIKRLISEKDSLFVNLENYLMGGIEPDEYTGYKNPDYKKLTELIVFFAQNVPCYKTKMNKLLFYVDFVMYREHGRSVGGTKYKAIPYGPVPNSFESIFESLAKQNVINILYEELPEGGQKQFLEGRKDRPFNKDLFSDDELSILEMVSEKFKNTKPYEIVELSHRESAWLENEHSRSFISYHYAMDLKAV